jgi:hypothetical protein
MKAVSYALIAIAGIAFVAGVVIKLFVDPASLPAWLAPVTLWRGAVGSLVFAMAFLLLDIREALAKRG